MHIFVLFERNIQQVLKRKEAWITEERSFFSYPKTMISSDPPNSNHLIREYRFPARANELCQTRTLVRTALTNCDCCSVTVEDVVLAIDEACQNIIRHAYGGDTSEEIVLNIERDGEMLVISLRDYAPEVGVDCMKLRDLGEIRPGGLGCHFIQEVMDDVSLGRPSEGRGNVLRMVKRMN